MSELIQACKLELTDNIPYLRRPLRTLSAINQNLKQDRLIGVDWELIDVAQLIAGSLIFTLVVAPVGIICRLTRPKR